MSESERGRVPLIDSSGSMAGRPDRISRRYDEANKKIGGSISALSESKKHYVRLKDAVREIIVNNAHPFILADVASKAVQAGLPVDPHAMFAPEHVLAYEARYICLSIPTLSNLHGDARAWLAHKLRRPAERIEASVAWNMTVGGSALNQEGT